MDDWFDDTFDSPFMMQVTPIKKEKIKEFKFQLNSTLLNQLSINGKIYIDQDNIFIDLYTDVDYFQCFSHN